jgi:membrane-bound lytic murein transglycosylase A
MKRILLLTALLVSCSRAELKDSAQAYHPSETPVSLRDTLDIGSLRMALERNLAALEKGGPALPADYTFGKRKISRAEYQAALKALRPELETWERFQAFVRENFDFYDVYGGKSYGAVFSTGYYDPVMEGSLKPTERFSQPLYAPPDDMITIDLQAFAERNPGLAPLQSLVSEQRSPRATWRGRYIAAQKKVIPYYQRSEIDGPEHPLAGKKLELVYLDPIDSFFLEIQGSGIVKLDSGKRMRVGYAAQNGSPYQPIGKYLTQHIPLAEMSMQRIRAYLGSVGNAERDRVLFLNPSYVFFKPLEGQSLTYSGAEVTSGRTIATDRGLYPKGVLGYYDIEEPTFADSQAIAESGWEAKPRFVFDQDTGGAIRGGGRVDLYMGQDASAARKAGVMKRNGRLYGLAPTEKFLERLKAAK